MNPKMRDMDNKAVYDPFGFPIDTHHNKTTGEAAFSIPGDDDVADSTLDDVRLINQESNAKLVDHTIEHDKKQRERAHVPKSVGPFPKYGFESEGRGLPAGEYSAPDESEDYGTIFRNNERWEANQSSPSRGNLLVKPLTHAERLERLRQEKTKERGGKSRSGAPLNREPLPNPPALRPYVPGERHSPVARNLLGVFSQGSLTTQDKDDIVHSKIGVPAAKRITSLKEQIARYYGPAGGVEGALDKAQEAQEQNPGNLNRKRWPLQTRSGVERDQLVGYGNRNEGTVPDAKAYYQWPHNASLGVKGLSPTHTAPGFNFINDAWDDSFEKNNDRQGSLEHELTHASILGGPDGRTLGIAEGIEENEGPFSEDREYTGKHAIHNPSQYYNEEQLEYVMDPAEIDVRLAEVKRRYAQHTGIIVDTPEKAEQALKWWGDTHWDRKYEMREKDSGNHDLWNMLTPDQKDEILYRMPELVMDMNVLEGLA